MGILDVGELTEWVVLSAIVITCGDQNAVNQRQRQSNLLVCSADQNVKRIEGN